MPSVRARIYFDAGGALQYRSGEAYKGLPTEWTDVVLGHQFSQGYEYRPKPVVKEPIPKSLNVQVGGNHYKDMKIQPIEYIHANGLGFLEGNAIKYITRYKSKGGVQDLQKAKHYIEMLIELETKQHAVHESQK